MGLKMYVLYPYFHALSSCAQICERSWCNKLKASVVLAAVNIVLSAVALVFAWPIDQSNVASPFM